MLHKRLAPVFLIHIFKDPTSEILLTFQLHLHRGRHAGHQESYHAMSRFIREQILLSTTGAATSTNQWTTAITATRIMHGRPRPSSMPILLLLLLLPIDPDPSREDPAQDLIQTDPSGKNKAQAPLEVPDVTAYMLLDQFPAWKNVEREERTVTAGGDSAKTNLRPL